MAKRIIPCLDIKGGRVVKGVNFVNLQDAGDPVELARAYEQAGADELAILDIGGGLSSSTAYRRLIMELMGKITNQIKLPLIFGGGISNLTDAQEILAAGADKISLGSAAVKTPKLIEEIAQELPQAGIVVAIDAKKSGPEAWEVFIGGGKVATGLDALAWAQQVASLGAKEILLTSMDGDGTQNGYDLELTKQVVQAAEIPVIASGGAGTLEHLYQGLTTGQADAVLAASIFHFGKITIQEAKTYLTQKGVQIHQ